MAEVAAFRIETLGYRSISGFINRFLVVIRKLSAGPGERGYRPSCDLGEGNFTGNN
jgi:hypothetical protein